MSSEDITTDDVWEIEVDGAQVRLRRLTKPEWLTLVDLGNKSGGIDQEEATVAFARIATSAIVSPTPAADVVAAYPGVPIRVVRILSAVARGERVRDADRLGVDPFVPIDPDALSALKAKEQVWTFDVGTCSDAIVVRRLNSTEFKALQSKLDAGNSRRSYVAMERALRDVLRYPASTELDDIVARYPAVAVRVVEDLQRIANGDRLEHAKKA